MVSRCLQTSITNIVKIMHKIYAYEILDLFASRVRCSEIMIIEFCRQELCGPGEMVTLGSWAEEGVKGLKCQRRFPVLVML